MVEVEVPVKKKSDAEILAEYRAAYSRNEELTRMIAAHENAIGKLTTEFDDNVSKMKHLLYDLVRLNPNFVRMT